MDILFSKLLSKCSEIGKKTRFGNFIILQIISIFLIIALVVGVGLGWVAPDPAFGSPALASVISLDE